MLYVDSFRCRISRRMWYRSYTQMELYCNHKCPNDHWFTRVSKLCNAVFPFQSIQYQYEYISFLFGNCLFYMHVVCCSVLYWIAGHYLSNSLPQSIIPNCMLLIVGTMPQNHHRIHGMARQTFAGIFTIHNGTNISIVVKGW